MKTRRLFAALLLVSLQSPAQNMIKLNLPGVAINTYSLQYERVLTRKFSFALAFRTMPNGLLPMKDKIIDKANITDPDVISTMNALKMSNTAITPEFRFYLSKRGRGRGFYIAPFYRYSKYTVSNMEFTIEDSPGNTRKIGLGGSLTSNTGGLLFGAQWRIAKVLCLDFWFFGPHYGNGNGSLSGTSSIPLTTNEQNDIRDQLNDIDIPLTTKTVTVNASGASMTLKGPWAGIRTGLCLGIWF